jgi:ABC-type sugar transport system ATPase subunit
MSIRLEIEKLTKTFDKEAAIEDVNFIAEPGELFALLGPSGAGKSTTLNCIAGLVEPDNGEIRADGESVLGIKPQFRDFSMVFESYALYPHLTVAENMAFPLKAPIRSGEMSEEEKMKRVRETAQMLEIPELIDRFPKELSGGQKQRVGLGRALVRRPRLFLMDEPIAHLDAKLRHHMRGELKKLIKGLGITTILATPDYNEVVAMADRALILNQGHMEQLGTPVELYNHPYNEVVARSIGDPPINLLDCEIKKTGDVIHLIGKSFSIQCDPELKSVLGKSHVSKELVFGIRPQELTIEKDADKGLIKGEVYVFEPLGGEAVATISLEDKLVKVVCPWEDKLSIGEKVGLNFSMANAHIFEKKSSLAVYA